MTYHRLTEDRLSTFSLSTRGHGRCVERVRDLGLPLLVWRNKLEATFWQ